MASAGVELVRFAGSKSELAGVEVQCDPWGLVRLTFRLGMNRWFVAVAVVRRALPVQRPCSVEEGSRGFCAAWEVHLSG